MTDREIRTWFIKLLSDLAAARGIVVESERRSKLLGLLLEYRHEINFSLADQWILKGDWTYKKNLMLELSDFYPSEANLKSIGVKYYSEKDYLTLAVKLSDVKRNYDKIYADNQVLHETYRKSDISQLNLRIAELELISVLKDREISKLKTKIEKLEKAREISPKRPPEVVEKMGSDI